MVQAVETNLDMIRHVDIMPTDEEILGFSNRWYSQTLYFATTLEMAAMQVVTGPYFLARKVEAY